MPTYQAPVDDALFLINDVFHIERYDNVPGFADASPDLVGAILEEAGKFCSEVLTPLNRIGDKQGCKRHDDGSVTTPEGFKDAFKRLVEGGWIGLSCPTDFGGQGLPTVVNQLVTEFLASANMAFTMYAGLTQGAIAAIYVHGSPEQKAAYLPNLIAGHWTGTMNLTEPHCGTDLGLLRTKAVPQADGSYKITGTKIFISAGEHDLAENIIHLVLARIEGAPAGTRGISLFVVPKFLVNPDGSIGARNGVACGSIEEKMGIHANSTCVMNFDAATGWLIGEANRGLNAMFVMMNEARLGVGVQGLAVSEVAYQNAAIYARERLQGRSIAGVKFPDKAADPIIVHPDVRRGLMTIKAFNEAAQAATQFAPASKHDGPPLAEGQAPGIEATEYYSPPASTWAYGVHAAIIEVDPQLCTVKIQKYVCIHDCGNMINPMIMEGQVCGGIAQGIGGALYEKLEYQPDGNLANASLMDFLVPYATEIPPVSILHLETPSPLNPLGVKGVGEAGCIAVGAVVASGVEDALRPLGPIKIRHVPLTPRMISEALEQAGV